jgi:DNA-binding CsgD family transcriptional regulator
METKLDDRVPAAAFRVVSRPSGGERDASYSDRPLLGWSSLTGRERSVADLVAEGLTNREAATRLFVSPHTVDAHLRHIFRKLEIRSRVQLAREAAIRGA